MKPDEIIKSAKEQFANGIIAEIEKRESRLIKVPVTWDTLKDLMRDVLDPKPAEDYQVPFYARPVIPPEYPKLKVRYGGADLTEQEWLIANSMGEEAPYHVGGWLTRPMTELARLKSTNIPERLKDDAEQRKATAARSGQKGPTQSGAN